MAEKSAKANDRTDGQLEAFPSAPGAEVSLELDKPEYFLGENIILHWHIRNKGDQPFKISIGGDNQTGWANRANRFKVEAFDAEGNPCPDPYPHPKSMGGWYAEPTLGRGQDFWNDLQLMRYREFTKAGTYTIKVYHDLGWEKAGAGVRFQHEENSDIPQGELQRRLPPRVFAFSCPTKCKLARSSMRR